MTWTSGGDGVNLYVFLNKEPTGFTDGLDMRHKRKRRVKNDFKAKGLRKMDLLPTEKEKIKGGAIVVFWIYCLKQLDDEWRIPCG